MPKRQAHKVKHIPQRTCVGCRQVLPKRTLTRIVRTGESVRIDPTGKADGRGAYLHNLRSCWERGLKGSLAHTLKCVITDQDREMLRTFMAGMPIEPAADVEAALSEL
ncbi:MAG: YlxR family protein [Anaerolineaceae bacterium]|nr:YlxR family protein [Anaerolineaceae bacterium]